MKCANGGNKLSLVTTFCFFIYKKRICEFQIELLGRTLTLYCWPLWLHLHCQPNEMKNSLAPPPGRDFWGGDGGNQRWEERPGGDEESRSYSKSSGQQWWFQPYCSPHHSPLFLSGAIGEGFEGLGRLVIYPEKQKMSFCSYNPDGGGHLYLENALDIRVSIFGWFINY